MKKLIIAIFVFGYTHGSAQSFFESFEDWNSISSILYPANWSAFPEIDSVLLNVERVNAISHGQHSINLKSNIPHWEGNFDTYALNNLPFYTDSVNIRFTFKCEGEGKCLLFLGQGISGSTGENMKNIWEVDAGDSAIHTVVLENIAIDPPFNEFRTIQFMASPVWSPVGSYGISFFSIDSLLVQNISLATAILDVENILTVSVFPNPANNWTTFKYELHGSNEEATIQVSDVFGNIVERFTVTEKRGQKIWDTSKVPSGIYFYTFTVNGVSKSGKIVIRN